MARVLSALRDLLRGLLGADGPLRLPARGGDAARVLEERYRRVGRCC